MSILIKGMEMPTSCGHCPFKYLTMEGDECMFDVAYTTYQSRPKDCPLVPVPKHGRLIDGDKLNDYLKTAAIMADGEAKDAYIDARAEARTMPTIIPASEEGE